MTELMLLPGTLCDDRLWSAQVPTWSSAPGIERVRHTPLEAPTIEGMARAVLRGAGSSLTLIGCSLGGIVAQTIHRLAPERVAALVLVSTTGRPPRPEQREHWQQLAEWTETEGVEAVARRLLPSLVHDTGEPHCARLVVDMARATGPETYLNQLAAQATRVDERPGLADCHMPVLVISAEHDRLCPPTLGAELAATAPHGQFELITGTGHLSPLEAPHRVRDVIDRWLRQREPHVSTAS